jgi:hypothetical protein
VSVFVSSFADRKKVGRCLSLETSRTLNFIYFILFYFILFYFILFILSWQQDKKQGKFWDEVDSNCVYLPGDRKEIF